MSFAEDLRESTASRSSAFLQFVLYRPQHPTTMFVFVEDKDDIRFYTHFAGYGRPVRFLAAGGKQSVISIYEEISSNHAHMLDVTSYIVDRDLDEVYSMPHAENILRTLGYSWEAHSVDPEALERLLTAYTVAPLAPEAKEAISDGWAASYNEFEPALVDHSALIVASAMNGGGFDMEEFPVVNDVHLGANLIAPGPLATAWLVGKRQELTAVGVTDAQIVSHKNAVSAEGAGHHGRILFRLYKRYIQHAKSIHLFELLVEITSPLYVTTVMPYDWAKLDYVRTYLDARLVKLAEDFAA